MWDALGEVDISCYMLSAACYQHGRTLAMYPLNSAFCSVKLFDSGMDYFLFSQVLKLR
jgi:hypothetical protein